MKYEDITTCSCGSTKFSLDDKLLQTKGLYYKVCVVCGKKHQVDVKRDRCFKCKKEYNSVNWCIPSGCPHCRRSFVV
jgi:hypothetical protein